MARGGELVKLTFLLDSFHKNVAKMQAEDLQELEKVLTAGAIVYANTAAKFTPPDPGKSKFSPLYYSDGVLYDRSSNARVKGLRRVYDLLALARNPSTGHYRKYYGKLLRKGYYFVVSIKRPGKKLVQMPCRTEAEAVRYAHETYRGILRAAWGLSLPKITGKAPAGPFRKLITERPRIGSKSGTGSAVKNGNTIVITNNLATMSDSYMADLTQKAEFAALRTMTQRMEKYFTKKKNDL